MITKSEALRIAIESLKQKSIKYTSVAKEEDVRFSTEEKIPWGRHKGESLDTYWVWYSVGVRADEITLSLCIDAKTGEVLFFIGPHHYFL